MGTWSAAIFGNDSAAEIYEYFKRMYKYQEGNNFKWTVDDIVDSLYTYYFDDIQTMASEKANFFFAITHALWGIGVLNPSVLNTTRQLIEDRIDYNAWKELEADEKTLKQRLIATENFLKKVSVPNESPKSRKLSPSKLSGLVLGDCLACHHRRKYFGLVVVNDGRNVDDGSNELAFVNIQKDSLPTIEDFENSSLLLNEELVNAMFGISTTEPANPPVAFIFRFSKAAIEKAKREFINVGQIPFVRTHFEWSAVRVTTASGKVASVKKLVETAANYWADNPWKVSSYKIAADKKGPDYAITGNVLKFDGFSIPLDKIYVKIENSLWHINVWVHVKEIPLLDIEEHWLVFADYVEKRTGREINVFKLLGEKDVQLSDLLPATTMDYEKYKLKHVKDSNII